MRAVGCCVAVVLIAGCTPGEGVRGGQVDTTVARAMSATEGEWAIHKLDSAPARFRPQVRVNRRDAPSDDPPEPGPARHWLYDAQWRRRPTGLPPGRAFSARGGSVVVLTDADADSSSVVLITRERLSLGHAGRDARPVFTRDGTRGALLTDAGVRLIERQEGSL